MLKVVSEETLVAIASPPGMGAVSLLRISGPEAFRVACRAMGRRKSPIERRATLVKLRDDAGGEIDSGLTTFFAGPRSYTGEDVVEFAGHGGVVVTRKVLHRFVEAGARLAEPGEFTQRAFLNGKLDLTQAEAVMDLITAQTDLALRSAREQLDGRLGAQCEKMRADLLGIVAHLEAYIDFPEEDIDPETGGNLCRRMEKTGAEIRKLLGTADQGRILREGARTVIFGKPNAGKSSLMNRLLGVERTIVNERAGTTRDMIEEVLNVDGIPVRLIDTAGLRESGDEIEQQGMAITEAQIGRADLVLELRDLSETYDETAQGREIEGVRHLRILNKCDVEDASWAGVEGLRVSCVTGEGLEALTEAIASALSLDESQWGLHSVAVNARHQACLQRTLESLEVALDGMRGGLEVELVSVDLREALSAVGDIAGVVDTEEILGEIFGSFCIGK